MPVASVTMSHMPSNICCNLGLQSNIPIAAYPLDTQTSKIKTWFVALMMSSLLHNLHLSFFLEYVNMLWAQFCPSYVVPALQLLPFDPLSLLQMSPFPLSSFPQEPSGIRIPLLAAPANRLLWKSQITSLSKTHKASWDPAITGQVQASGHAPTGCVAPAFWCGPLPPHIPFPSLYTLHLLVFSPRTSSSPSRL